MKNLRPTIFLAFLLLFSTQSFSQLVVFCGDELTVDNNTGVNNLENYPERPGFVFSGSERLVQLPVSNCGEVCIEISNRQGGNVDLFVLTDPNDASSNILWINGIGGMACFTSVPGIKYYLSFDGLGGSIASFELAVTCKDPCVPDPIDPAFEASTVPTMGEWGLISVGLLLMIFGIISLKQKKAIIA